MSKHDIEGAQRYFAAKMAYTTGPYELSARLQSGEVNVIDVREPDAYAQGHIPGAINLPKGDWSHAELARDRLNVFYCYSQTCHLAAAAALEFARRGVPVAEMEGGFPAWQANGLSVDTGAMSEVMKKAVGCAC